MRFKYWAVLIEAGFEPFKSILCDWRKRGVAPGDVERVFISGVDNTFRTYGPDGASNGHGAAPWELEALI